MHGNDLMFKLIPRSLKGLLIFHESAFLVLVVVTGALGGLSAYYWQQSSLEAIRLNVLMHQTQRIRGDMYRQLKEVTRARLTEDPSGLGEYSDYTSRIDAGFRRLLDEAADEDERLGITYMQQTYRVVRDDMDKVFVDPYEINEAARMKLLDPAYEEWMLADFESAVRVFSEIVSQRRQALESSLARWTVLARVLIPAALLLAVLLVFISRRTLRREFLAPIRDLTRGASELSRGRLDHELEERGVDELARLAASMNHMARELEASRDALLENERQAALGSLVPVVAHNIRNPLASIRATAQLIDDSADRRELETIRGGIIEAVDRLERWVRSLLSYLHPLEPYARRVRLTSVVDGAVEPLKTRLAEKSIDLVCENWDVDSEILADPDLLEQALHGLLNNAIEASPRGARIVVSVTRDSDEIALTIDDQGPGIPFEPNPSDLKPLTSTKRFGTGLGLPFAFKVCHTHGGRVSVSRRPEGGTRAAVRLPLRGSLTESTS